MQGGFLGLDLVTGTPIEFCNELVHILEIFKFSSEVAVINARPHLDCIAVVLVEQFKLPRNKDDSWNERERVALSNATSDTEAGSKRVAELDPP